MKYLVLSLYDSKPESPLFWRGIGGNGYTFNPLEAYQFTLDQVKGIEEFINNGKGDTIVVPISGEAFDQLGFSCSIDPEGWKSFLNKPITA